MPCFKGLAVSIHTTDGPLPEYSVNKQQRNSRIQTYIPVPQPKLNASSGRAEPASFAISITLLTPGQPVPYSKPEATPSNPSPHPKVVGSMMPQEGARGKYMGMIGPYIPLTSSANETVAAYIHFDGRVKEEVATLLRRGEETWVNSRWVGIPETEGGGLAEREFLFREVGLERWLNGLDLKGETQENAARIERRKRRLEKKRRVKLENRDGSDDDEIEMSAEHPKRRTKDSILRYGEDKNAPVEGLSDDESMGSSDTDPEDEMPIPEAAGQIKISLFRVLASGEVKKGEYSPQFDAHDDDDMNEGAQGGDGSADVDHTTTFAKPKTLDPKTISTQTVTGIDPPNKPYATFTFFYRGKKQLQKMGIITSGQPASSTKEPTPKKNKTLDASSLKPLKSNKGTVGFTGYRDSNPASSGFGNGIKTEPDSDDDDDEGSDISRKRKSNGPDKGETEDVNGDKTPATLSPEEAAKSEKLADSVKKMQLKRQHSFEASTPATAAVSTNATSESQDGQRGSDDASRTPPSTAHPDSQATSHANPLSKLMEPSASVGSPFKKQRASLSNTAETSSPTSVSPFSTGEAHSVPPTIDGTAASKHATFSPANGETSGTQSPARPVQGSEKEL
ncbi:MAG: hypothetical protein Q9162_005968 [Coniocarpon cinnabarinum]